MRNFMSVLRQSMKNFKSLQAITVCGMLIALETALKFFTLPVGNLIKIGFSFLPIAVAGMLFGPAVSAAAGAVGDLLCYFVQPTGPFFPGFTLNALVSGFLYGAVLYKKPVSFSRVLTAKALDSIIVSLLLNPLWLSVLYGKAFFAVLSARIITNLILFPIDAALLFAVLKTAARFPVHILNRESR